VGGIWNTFAAEADQNKARAAEIENAKRVRTEFLEGKQYLTDVEKRQLDLYDKQIARLRQDYENSKSLQESILARQQQAAQQGYGGALGATGMSYAAAQPGLMRGLAARGMLGTGAEAAARAGLAGRRAAAIETAAQNYSDVMSKAYESDAQTRGRQLSALSTGETTIDTARTKFNNDMAAAQFQLNQGNRREADRLADQAAKDYAAAQQQRGSDIFQGITAVAGSPEFKTAMGAAFGPSTASTGGGLGMPESTYNKFMSGDYGDDEMARYYGYGSSPGGVTAPAPTVGPTVNATAKNFTEAGRSVPAFFAEYANELPTSAENLARGGLWQAPMVFTPPSAPFATRRYDNYGNLIEENGVPTNPVTAKAASPRQGAIVSGIPLTRQILEFNKGQMPQTALDFRAPTPSEFLAPTQKSRGELGHMSVPTNLSYGG
jgi:hypothetical protein